MLTKTKPIRSQKLRDSAGGEDCTLNIEGACNYDPSTTVLCHLPDDSGTGKMGGKSCDATCTVYGCSGCHDYLDRRTKRSLEHEIEGIMDILYFARVRTLRRMIEKGLIKIA